ncbi:ABC transporter ATP-binding protein [Paenibacillus sp. WLX2291]|uniref:ABC transporter ATP-binding protein n=1 Tax=Paenibacillus sp. WLX2291 TaxID=3296934 RepID=UPI003983EBE5
MDMAKPAVVLRQVSYVYDGSEQAAVQQIDLQIQQAQWIAIVGASGSGKSTLCRLINGQLPRLAGGQRQGEVCIQGIDPAEAPIGELAAAIGSLGQDPDAELVVGTVEDEIAFGPENLCLPPAEIGSRIERLTTTLALEHVRHRRVHQLSGGQRQRTALAAVLALEPQMLLLDEPAASLDPAGRQQVLRMIGDWHAAGGTLITASARWDDSVQRADRVIVLEKGRIVLEGTPTELLQLHGEDLRQLYILPALLEMEAEKADKSSGFFASKSVSPSSQQSSVPSAYKSPASLQSEPSQQQQAPLVSSEKQRSSSTMLQPIVDIRQLDYTYAGSSVPALHHISLSLYPGEMVLLCGANGSGKTTLTRLLTGLLTPPSGHVFRHERDSGREFIDTRAQDTGYLFQHPDHQWVAPTVWDECIFGIRAQLNLRRRQPLPQLWVEQVEQKLAQVGLLAERDASPYSLSAGQKRLLSATAQFLLERPLYILDEPGAAVDYFTVQHILQQCRTAMKRGAALLIVTHEPELFSRDATRIITLAEGRIQSEQHLHPASDS